MQATCLCVLAAVLALVVKRGSPETALLLVLGAAVAVLLSLGQALEEAVAFLEELGRRCPSPAGHPGGFGSRIRTDGGGDPNGKDPYAVAAGLSGP